MVFKKILKIIFKLVHNQFEFLDILEKSMVLLDIEKFAILCFKLPKTLQTAKTGFKAFKSNKK